MMGDKKFQARGIRAVCAFEGIKAFNESGEDFLFF
jgi:hypothetical protein